MGTVNYIKGLYGPVRVRYPLGFAPTLPEGYGTSGGYAPASTCVIMGSGISDTYPETSSLASGKFLEWHLKTTNTGSGEVYGDYMSLQSAGTGTGYVYAKGVLAKSVTGGYVAELGACYYKSQLSAGTVTGQNYVGFFEYIVDTGVANMPSGGVIQLVDVVSGSLNAVHGYITLRTYGTTPFSNLFYIMDHTSGTGKLFYESTLKMNIGGTPYYIPLSTTERGLSLIGGIVVGVSGDGHDVTFYGDTVGCNFLWDQNLDTNGGLQLGADTKSTMFYAYGATTGNYLKWDAANDDLLLVGTATQLAVAGTTTSSSTTTGSLRTAGGLGVAGAAFIGGLTTSTSVTGFRSNATFVPDSTYTNYAFSVGNKVAELTVNFAQSTGQNFNPIQAIVNCTATGTGPTASSQTNLFFAQLTHDTNDMANLRLKCADFTTIVGENVKDAYCYQGEVDFNKAGVTVGGESAVMGLVMNAGADAVTGNLRGLIISMQGAGSYASVVGLEIRTTCGDVLGHGCSEAIRIAGTPLPVVGIAMGNQTNDNEGPQYAFFFPSTGSPDTGPWSATNASGDAGKIAIKIGTGTRYINVYTS